MLTPFLQYALLVLSVVCVAQELPNIRLASTGCATVHEWAGQTRTFSFGSSGGTRTYRIHLPSSYQPGTPKPLIIAYHGSGDNPTNFEKTTRFSDESVNPDTITVYPAGVNVCRKF